MKAKKYRHADLENKRGIFFQVGLIIALGASLAAFEWSSTPNEASVISHDDYYEETEVIPEIIRPEQPKEAIPKPIPIHEIIIVDNGDEIDGEILEINDEYGDEPIDFGNTYDEPDEAPTTFIRVEKMPEFPGGSMALMKYIANSINYPHVCIETGIAGRVYVSFVVNEHGQVVEAKVVRSPDSNLSKEALRVVNNMPQWTPGKQRDKAVRVSYTIPVNFVLQ